jgi:hypothetical protein
MSEKRVARTARKKDNYDEEVMDEDLRKELDTVHAKEEALIEHLLGKRRAPEGGVQYLVKWRERSYLHVEWLSEDMVEADYGGARRIKIYEAAHAEADAEGATHEYFDPSFVQVERIVDSSEDQTDPSVLASEGAGASEGAPAPARRDGRRGVDDYEPEEDDDDDEYEGGGGHSVHSVVVPSAGRDQYSAAGPRRKSDWTKEASQTISHLVSFRWHGQLLSQLVDLSFVRDRLITGGYAEALEFSTAVRNILRDSVAENPDPKGPIRRAAERLSIVFERVWARAGVEAPPEARALGAAAAEQGGDDDAARQQQLLLQQQHMQQQQLTQQQLQRQQQQLMIQQHMQRLQQQQQMQAQQAAQLLVQQRQQQQQQQQPFAPMQQPMLQPMLQQPMLQQQQQQQRLSPLHQQHLLMQQQQQHQQQQHAQLQGYHPQQQQQFLQQHAAQQLHQQLVYKSDAGFHHGEHAQHLQAGQHAPSLPPQYAAPVVSPHHQQLSPVPAQLGAAGQLEAVQQQKILSYQQQLARQMDYYQQQLQALQAQQRAQAHQQNLLEQQRRQQQELLEQQEQQQQQQQQHGGGGGLMFRVKWKGLSYADMTWESASDILDDTAVAAYYKRNTVPKRIAPAPLELVRYSESPAFKGGLMLRSYQLEGLNWLAFNHAQGRGSILADEMGLGKTCQTVAFCSHLQPRVQKPVLVVAPLSTLGHWRNEFERWSDLNAVVYHDLGNRQVNGINARAVIREVEFFYWRRSRRNRALVEAVPGLWKFDVPSCMSVAVARCRRVLRPAALCL